MPAPRCTRCGYPSRWRDLGVALEIVVVEREERVLATRTAADHDVLAGRVESFKAIVYVSVIGDVDIGDRAGGDRVEPHRSVGPAALGHERLGVALVDRVGEQQRHDPSPVFDSIDAEVVGPQAEDANLSTLLHEPLIRRNESNGSPVGATVAGERVVSEHRRLQLIDGGQEIGHQLLLSTEPDEGAVDETGVCLSVVARRQDPTQAVDVDGRRRLAAPEEVLDAPRRSVGRQQTVAGRVRATEHANWFVEALSNR